MLLLFLTVFSVLTKLPITWVGWPLKMTELVSLTIEDCTNGIDDDNDGLVDLRDPACRCAPRPLPTGTELITNGGFEDVRTASECQGCISLFDSDNCPEGWQQESVNLHTPCFTDANPAVNIGYINTNTGNYQGVGGFGVVGDGRRQQEEYLATRLDSPLDAGQAYRFAASFALPIATVPDINQAPVHRIIILGSLTGPAFERSPDRCYSDNPNWSQLAVIEIENRTQPVFVNYEVSFIATGNYRHLAIASDCCQPGQDTLMENLTYWAIDNVSLKAADLAPVDVELTVNARGCAQDVLLCAEAPPGGNWTYQWYQDSVALLGETAACLALPIAEVMGQNFSCWVIGPDNCSLVSITVDPDLPCGPQPEDCDNGIDDDGDGLADELDPDCICNVTDLAISISAEPPLLDLGNSTRLRIITNLSFPEISWSPAEGLDCSNCLSPNAAPISTTTYTVTLNDPSSGCSISDSIRVIVVPNRQVYAPNAFSPNADGVNDQWALLGGPGVLGISNLFIYDRWGGQVYYSPTAEAWNGLSSGQALNMGTYLFTAEVTYLDGVSERVRGVVFMGR